MSNINPALETEIETISETLNEAKNFTIELLRAHLLVEGFKKAEINAAIKKLGLTSVRVGFKGAFYDWLVEAPRSEAETKAYIAANGSANVIKHSPAHLAVWALTVKLRESLES